MDLGGSLFCCSCLLSWLEFPDDPLITHFLSTKKETLSSVASFFVAFVLFLQECHKRLIRAELTGVCSWTKMGGGGELIIGGVGGGNGQTTAAM